MLSVKSDHSKPIELTSSFLQDRRLLAQLSRKYLPAGLTGSEYNGFRWYNYYNLDLDLARELSAYCVEPPVSASMRWRVARWGSFLMFLITAVCIYVKQGRFVPLKPLKVWQIAACLVSGCGCGWVMARYLTPIDCRIPTSEACSIKVRLPEGDAPSGQIFRSPDNKYERSRVAQWVNRKDLQVICDDDQLLTMKVNQAVLKCTYAFFMQGEVLQKLSFDSALTLMQKDRLCFLKIPKRFWTSDLLYAAVNCGQFQCQDWQQIEPSSIPSDVTLSDLLLIEASPYSGEKRFDEGHFLAFIACVGIEQGAKHIQALKAQWSFKKLGRFKGLNDLLGTHTELASALFSEYDPNKHDLLSAYLRTGPATLHRVQIAPEFFEHQAIVADVPLAFFVPQRHVWSQDLKSRGYTDRLIRSCLVVHGCRLCSRSRRKG